VPELLELASTHEDLAVRRLALNKLANNAQYSLVSAYASNLSDREEAVNDLRSSINNRMSAWKVAPDAPAEAIDEMIETKWKPYLSLHDVDVTAKLATLADARAPTCSQDNESSSTSEDAGSASDANPSQDDRAAECVSADQKPSDEELQATNRWFETWALFVIPEIYRAAQLHDRLAVRRVALQKVSDAEVPAKITAEAIDKALEGIPKPFMNQDANRFAYTSQEQVAITFLDTRFAKYIGNLVNLNFGISHVTKQPVMATIWSKLKYTVSMSFLSIFLSFLISVPLGVWSAYNQNTIADQIVTALLLMLYSLPTFFAAVLLLEFFATGDPFNLFPLGGFVGDNPADMTTVQYVGSVLWHLCLPVFCLTYFSLATLSRYARTGILDVIRADYIRTARAKGLSESMVIIKHAVRNGMIPILTLLGTQLPRLIGGSIVLEVVFGIPGMGEYLFESITLRDYNAIMAVLLCSAVLTLIGILISDISYAIVDPRISFD
jgi:peptide/nickel transport system permease protein